MFGLIYQGMSTGHVISRDYMVMPRISFYVSALMFSSVICAKRNFYKNDLSLMYALGAVFVCVTLAQYYNLFGINEIVKPFAPENMERMGILVSQAGWRRAVGTLGNPNYWGLLIAMWACVVSYRLFWQKRWIYAPLLLALLGSIFLTGSRAALVAYVGALVAGGGLFLFTVKKKPSLAIVTFFLVLAGVAIMRLDLSSEIETSDRYSLDNLGTLEMRVNVWRRILHEMSQDPISFVVGQGTRKGTNIVGFADNAYIKILREHGIFGLVPYLFLIGFMMRRTLKLVKTIDDGNRAWPGGLLLLLFAWVIFDLSADTWYGPRLMGVILGLYAFVHMVGANRLNEKPAHIPVAMPENSDATSRVVTSLNRG